MTDADGRRWAARRRAGRRLCVYSTSVLLLSMTVPASGVALPGRCAGAVDLAGPPAVVESLRTMLSRRGVAVVAAAGCQPARAQVAMEGEGYAVSIDDGEGRRSERRVVSLESAGTLIETWVRPELGPLPALPSPPPVAAVARSGIGSARARAASVGVAAETAMAARDRSLWVGGQVFAGVAWGPLWLGGKGRLAVQQLVPGRRPGEGGSGTDAEALVQVGWPISLRRLHLVPAVGVGCGWWRATATSASGDNAEETEASSGPTLRAELGASVQVPLTTRLSAVGGLAFDFLPRASASTGEEGAPIESRGYLRLSVGLRVEGP